MIRRFIIIIIFDYYSFYRVRHHLFFRVMGRRMGRRSLKKNCAEVVLLLHSARSVRPCVWPVSFRHSGKKDEQHAMVSLSKMYGKEEKWSQRRRRHSLPVCPSAVAVFATGHDR